MGKMIKYQDKRCGRERTRVIVQSNVYKGKQEKQTF